MRIDVRGLLGRPGSRQEYDLREVKVPPVSAGGIKICFEPAHARLTLTSTSRGVLASGTVASAAHLTCSRCLAAYQHPVCESFEHLFLEQVPEAQSDPAIPREASGGEVPVRDEEGTDGEGMDVSPILDGEVDLGPVLLAVLDLATPMKPLCRPDCRGLCPACGQPLDQGPCRCPAEGVDPRLAGLARLLPGPPGGDHPGDDQAKERKG